MGASKILHKPTLPPGTNWEASQHQGNSAGLAEQGLALCFVDSPFEGGLGSNTAETAQKSCSA